MDYLPLIEEGKGGVGGCDHRLACEWSGGQVTPLRPGERAIQGLDIDAQRLASIGRYAGRIAHDFNNLLTPIISAAQLAMYEHSPSEEVAGLLEHIITAARRASELSRQMTRFTGQGELMRTRVNLSMLVGEMMGLLRVPLPPDVRLRYEPTLPIWVEADVTQLRQVLMNLVVNAAEAIGSRPGVISVAVGTLYVGAQTVVPGLLAPLREGRYAFLRVSDTGSGIDLAARGRIFEPGFTTKGDGSGIGLSTVRAITRAHGGELSVVSEPGQGATFGVWLPLEVLGEDRVALSP
jgi:signal transduction histidine kinase